MIKKILTILFMISKICFADDINIKSDDFYNEQFIEYYFENLKDLINQNKIDSLKNDFLVTEESLENMKNIAKKVYIQKGYIENLEYTQLFSVYNNNEYYNEILMSYDILINKKRIHYDTVIDFGYSFFNGGNFRITFFREEEIKIKKIDYYKIENIIKNNKSIDKEKIIEQLEKENIITILKYIPIEIEIKKYISILNDYAYFLSETERYKEAIPILERVIVLAPNRVVAYLNLGDCYYKEYKKYNRESDKMKVIENYKKYLSLLKKDAKIPERVKEMIK